MPLLSADTPVSPTTPDAAIPPLSSARSPIALHTAASVPLLSAGTPVSPTAADAAKLPLSSARSPIALHTTASVPLLSADTPVSPTAAPAAILPLFSIHRRKPRPAQHPDLCQRLHTSREKGHAPLHRHDSGTTAFCRTYCNILLRYRLPLRKNCKTSLILPVFLSVCRPAFHIRTVPTEILE